MSFVNAAPGFDSVQFRREEVLEADLSYRESSTALFGVDTYDFHLEVTPAGEEAQRLVSFLLNLAADTSYTIVALDVDGTLQHRLLESSGSAGGGDVDATLIHLGAQLPPVDVYLVAAGTDPATTAPTATLAFGQEIGSLTAPSGDSQIIVTEASNPAARLLTSTTLSLPAGQSILFAIVDDSGFGFAGTTVILAGGANLSIVDQDLDSRIRVINAISDRSALDFGIGGELDPPLLPNVAFGTITDFTSVAAGLLNLTGTPAGNPSVTEVDFEFTAARGRFQTLFVAGDPGAATTVMTANDFRQIGGEAKLSFYNGSSLFDILDLFVVAPGTDISTEIPAQTFTPGSGTADLRFAQGDYEITIFDPRTSAVVAGPLAVTLDDGGYYGMLITDAPGGSTVDVTQFDDFNM